MEIFSPSVTSDAVWHRLVFTDASVCPFQMDHTIENIQGVLQSGRVICIDAEGITAFIKTDCIKAVMLLPDEG